MIAVSDLVAGLGSGLLQVTVAGHDAEVGDITLAEPDQDVVGTPGDLVLGVGTADAAAAVDLLERSAAAGAGAVMLRAPLASGAEATQAARDLDLCLVELARHASWAHVVWLLRGVIDRAAAPGSPVVGDAGVHSDLFALADAAAAIVDAPVTIEDAQSRVLAYSSRQDVTDPARVSTIVGRRVPEELVAHFRAGGVFRKLARSSEPFVVPEGPGGTLPRLVIPVRAGGEWLGSIWAVLSSPVPPERVNELRQAASVLALHLLRLRAQAGVAQRVSTERLRAALRTARPGSDVDLWLPDGPWRVVALALPSSVDEARRLLDLWESIMRRFGWHQPLLTDLDGVALALVTDTGTDAATGSWPWLQRLVGEVRQHDQSLYAAAGGLARDRAGLPRSRSEAVEVARLLGTPDVPGPTAALDEVWHAVVVQRACAAAVVDGQLLGGPLGALRDHDAAHGTAYLQTLGAWLDHAGEPARAARALHVHPNTLRYRMARLAELAPLDVDSPTVRLALQLQLRALARR